MAPPVHPEDVPSVFYVERLTLAWIGEHAIFFIRAKVTKKIRVFYIDHDGFALILARGLAGICPVVFEALRFQSVEVTENGVSVRLKVTYQELAVIAGLIRRDMPALPKEESRLDLFLMKAPVFPFDFDSDGKYRILRQAVTLINIVRWHAQGIDALKEAPQLHLFQRPFSPQLCEYAQSRDIKLCLMKPYRSWVSPWRKAARKFSKLNLKVVGNLLRRFISAAFRLQDHRQEDLPAGDAKLLVESRLVFNLSRPDLVSDLFFLENQGGIRGEDVLLVFNGSLRPLDEDQYKAMRERGIHAMALTPQSSLVSPSQVPVFSLEQGDIGMDKRWRSEGMSGDYAQFAVQYAHIRSYWEIFFQRNNIKIWTSFYKNEPEHIAMADALAAVGGISAIYQRSYESNPSIILATGCDIIFSFSKAEYAIEKQNGSDFRYHVVTGYLGDYRFGHLKDRARQLREQLVRAGAKHIVAYFDENTIDDDRWYFDHRYAQDNYAFLLEKLLADPALGLIFKPKVSRTLRKRLGDVAGLLSAAEKTGRCYVFEQGETPAAASLASDLAIQESLAAGTSAVESALAGTRTVLMDCEGWPLSPLYRLGEDVVFKDWNSVWEACREYFKDPLIRPRLGDWSAMINELDPFRDGLAAQRMSGYLKELMEGLRRSEAPLDVMDRAAENYARRWGKDKVHRGPRI